MSVPQPKLAEVKIKVSSDSVSHIRNPMAGVAKLVSVLGINDAEKNKPQELTCLFDTSVKSNQSFEILKMRAVNLNTYDNNGYQFSFHNLGNDKVLKVATKL